MSETKTTKVQGAFDAAWDGDLQGTVLAKLILGHDKGDTLRRDVEFKDVIREVAKTAFVAGARTFSTMPLCEHGAAFWGVEPCELCDVLEKPPEFPGYNKPFGADLPEGMTEGDLEDLKVEHEAMRQTLFQILVKVEALDPEAVNAPWDPVKLLHFVGLWLSGSLPFANTKMVTVLQRLLRDLQGLEGRFLAHLKDHKDQSEQITVGQTVIVPETESGQA